MSLVLLVRADGYAYIFEKSCKVNLQAGSEIMGNKLLLGNPRQIQVFRGDALMASGSQYIPGESLSVKLVPTDTQFAFQIISGDAAFEGGSCNSNRIANKDSTVIVMPSTGGSDIEIIAGSASQFGQVKLTETFKLVAPSPPMSINFTPKSSPLPSTQPQLLGRKELGRKEKVVPGRAPREFKRHLQAAPPTWTSSSPTQASPTANIVLPHLPSDLVVFSIVQQVTNLDNAELDREEVRSAFVGAMTQCLQPVAGAPDSVTISDHKPCADKVRNKKIEVHLHSNISTYRSLLILL